MRTIREALIAKLGDEGYAKLRRRIRDKHTVKAKRRKGKS